MADKDKRYDPPINYESDPEAGDLNNDKVLTPSCSPPSYSDLEDIFIHNNLGGRRGGEMADHQPRQCKNMKCKKQIASGEKMYDGSAFSCSLMNPLPGNWAERHQFCKQCAHRDGRCPALFCNAPKLDKNHQRFPQELPD